MKMTLPLTFLTILGTSLLTGCGQKAPEPQIITKYVHIKPVVPEIKPAPKPLPYKTLKVMINGNEYYAFSKPDGAIVASNWNSYQSWANINYKSLMSIKKEVESY